MAVLGIGRRRGRSTLVLRDGPRLFAATVDRALHPAGSGVLQGLQEVLTSSGLQHHDIQSVVCSRGAGWNDLANPSRAGRGWTPAGLPQADLYAVSGTMALAAQALAMLPGDGVAVVGDDVAAVFSRRAGQLQVVDRIANSDVLLGSARCVASALGLERNSPLEALDYLAQSEDGGEWSIRFSRVLAACDDPAFSGGSDALSGVLLDAARGVPGRLDDTRPAHITVAARRRQVAAGFCEAVSECLTRVLRRSVTAHDGQRVVVTGDWFRIPRLAMRALSGLPVAIDIAPLETDAAAALGASLSVDPASAPHLRAFTFSAGYSADEVKRSLDRCRIDYVYEPSWERLLARVGRMLARGKQVAWCQGRADLGQVSFGSRSILTDPSNRYARDNLNGYLLRRPLDAPLTLAIAEDVGREAVQDVVTGIAPRFVTITEAWRERAIGILDDAGRNAVQVVSPASAPELSDLLTWCRSAHGMIGLVNVSLRCTNGTLARSPVEAITAFFAASIDALVIDRFLVMKDYWLLRSDT